MMLKDVFHGLFLFAGSFSVVPAGCRGKEFQMKDITYDLVFRNEAKEAIGMEAVLNRMITIRSGDSAFSRLRAYYESGREFCGAGEYRRYGKYLVKESFEGDLSLTQLLTEYIERTAALKY